MKYLKKFNENVSIKIEDIEDCSLELLDLPYNIYVDEYSGTKIKFIGEIIDEKYGLLSNGIWKDNKLSLNNRSHKYGDEIIANKIFNDIEIAFTSSIRKIENNIFNRSIESKCIVGLLPVEDRTCIIIALLDIL